MLAKFSGGESERTVSKKKKKEIVVLCSPGASESRLREIRECHVTVVQRWLRNVQNSVMHVQSCSFANINLFLFAVSRCHCRCHCLNSLFL